MYGESRYAEGRRAQLRGTADLPNPGGPVSDRLNNQILFNATLAQATRWGIAAKRDGGNLSEWLREAAEARFAAQFPDGFDPDDFFPCDVTTAYAEAVRAEA